MYGQRSQRLFTSHSVLGKLLLFLESEHRFQRLLPEFTVRFAGQVPQFDQPALQAFDL